MTLAEAMDSLEATAMKVKAERDRLRAENARLREALDKVKERAAIICDFEANRQAAYEGSVRAHDLKAMHSATSHVLMHVAQQIRYLDTDLAGAGGFPRHSLCPDENYCCQHGDDMNCPKLVTEETLDNAKRYQYLRDHWNEWSGNTWEEPIGPKLDAALGEAIIKASSLTFETHCPDGQKCGAITTGCRIGHCQRSYQRLLNGE